MPTLISKRIIQFVIAISLIFVNVQPVFADDLPAEAYVTGFVGYPQQRSLTCEIRSAVDVASFWGVSITEEELFDKIRNQKILKRVLSAIQMECGEIFHRLPMVFMHRLSQECCVNWDWWQKKDEIWNGMIFERKLLPDVL